MRLSLTKLGAAVVKGGSAFWQALAPLGGADEEDENLGENPVYQALGLTSFPAPADDTGFAEGILVEGIAGLKAFFIGARDTRNAEIVGKGEPGDTVLHTTGKNQTAQVQLKERKRIGAIVVKGESGEHMMVMLDGVGEKLQILARGACFEIAKNGDVSIMNGSKTGILIQGEDIHFMGKVHHQGIPKGMAIMCGAPPGQVAGPAAVLLVPAQGFGP